ncbi:MAG TPA: hypothetical protein VG710_04920, partial [Opitutus sp.]|nr:hypothetical protein [Opitutus sp.]
PARQATSRSPRWIKPVLASAGLVVLALGIALWQRANKPESARPPAGPPTATAPTEKLSPARELAERARAIARRPSLTRVQLDTAEELCEQALKLDATDAVVWAIAADVELYYVYPYGYDMSDERRRRVQERIARGASLDPEQFDVRVVRAKVLAHAVGTTASMAEAEKMFRELLTEHSGDHRLVVELAEVLRDQRRYDEAAKLFESVGEFEIAGWSYFQGSEPRAGLAAVRRAPRSVTALQLTATLEYTGNEDLAAAQSALDRLEPSELLAEMPATVAMRVALYRRDPARVLELAKGLSRDYLDAHGFRGPRAYFTGLAHAMAGQPAQAEAEWRAGLTVVESMLSSAPDDRQLLLSAAWLHAALQDAGTAETIFARSQALAGLEGDTLDFVNYPVLLKLRKKAAVLAGAEEYFRTKQPLWQILHAELRFSPEADFLRGDPRFEKLLRDYLPEGAKPL